MKSDKSSLWFARVDGNQDDLTNYCKTMKEWIDCKRVLALYHVGEKKDNPHIHFVIELNSVMQKQSFDARVKTLFKIEKRGQYSTKIWDGADSACGYMFHEPGAPIVCNKNFTEEELVRFRAVNDSFQKVIEINKSKASCRAPDRAIEHFKGESPSRRDVLELFITWIRNGEMYETGDYQMAKYIEEVIIKTTAQEDLSWYVDSRLKRIFRD